ncbi:alpha-ribazole phosphatase [Clostridiaceae bacterium UIB06]|nr:alpha-ribazole phosphatase [Clostridiaceae bacterium UIB06]
MNLYFVRHGETEHNKNQCYYGSIDVDITGKGVLQAQKGSEKLKNINFNKVYVSELKRAEQTANILMEGRQVELIKDKRINEINFGAFEGKSHKEIKEFYSDEWKLWCDDWKGFTPPEGECYIQFYDRIKSFMDDILKLDEDNVLIVTHGGVIRSVYCYLLGGNLDFFWSFGSKNGDITIIKYEYRNLYIDSITHI